MLAHRAPSGYTQSAVFLGSPKTSYLSWSSAMPERCRLLALIEQANLLSAPLDDDRVDVFGLSWFAISGGDDYVIAPGSPEDRLLCSMADRADRTRDRAARLLAGGSL